MSKTILCVDDSVTIQKVAEITFDASDFTYVGARNADEGLAAAKEKGPDLILADAVMPGKTGYDLCKSLKDDPALAGIPVLIMCGNSQAFDSARGTSVGADGHVVKPWDTQVMLDKVAEVLEAGPAAKPAAAPKPVAGQKSTPTLADIARSSKRSPLSKPELPSLKPLEPPRSATIMGMPSIKLPATPGSETDFGTAQPVARKPAPPVISRPKTVPRQIAKPEKLPVPIATSRPSPAPKPMTPVKAPVALPSLSPPISSSPFMTAPAAVGRAPSAGMPRPPMIKGTPRRRPESIAFADSEQTVVNTSMRLPLGAIPPEAEKRPAPMHSKAAASITPLPVGLAAKTSQATADVAKEAGLDPNGAEFKALASLSREVVERVVWEVVPELAETIIREHIAKNGLPG